MEAIQVRKTATILHHLVTLQVLLVTLRRRIRLPRGLAQTLTPALGWMMEITGRLQQNPRALMSLRRQDVLIWCQNAR
jgi:hypothetical protein